MTNANGGRADEAAAFNAALARLARARRRALARGVAAALVLAVLAALAAGLLLERVLPGARYVPFAVFLLFWGSVAAAVALVLPPLLPPPGPGALALAIGRAAGRGGFFHAAWDFARGEREEHAFGDALAGGRREHASPFLVAETLRRARAGLGALDPDRLFADAGRPRLVACALAAGIAAGVLAAAGGGAHVTRWIVDPAISFRDGPAAHLVVTAAPERVIAGGDAALEATSFGARPREVMIRLSAAPGAWRVEPLAPDTARAAGDAASSAAPLVVYRYTAEALQGDLRFVFEADGRRTPEQTVRVIRRPVVNGLGAILRPPAYTGASPDTIGSLAGRLVALAGTRVELAGETSAPVAAGELRFASGRSVPVEPAAGGFRAAFIVTTGDTFRAHVVDSLGLENERPVGHAILARADRAPGIEIISPADGDLLPRALETRIEFRADDDYGLGLVVLRFMREGKDAGFRALEIERPPAGVRAVEGAREWSLAGEKLFPGDRVLFYLETSDRNTATGPGRARTETRRLLVPTMSQIYADVRREETTQQEELEEIVDEGRRVRERIRSLSDEMKAEGEMDWSRRREGRELLERQERIGEQLDEAAERLDRTLDRLSENRMTSREVGEKLERIGELIDEIRDGELRDSIDRFRRLMEEMSREEALAAMEEVELSAENLVERLERTIELLEQVLREERMEELLRRAGEMLDEQRALRDSTEAGAEVAGRLAVRQETLADEMAALEEDAGAFAAADEDSALAGALEEALAEADTALVESLMRQAAEMMRQGRQGEACEAQQGAEQGMINLYSRLSSCRMSMSITIDAALLREIEKGTRRLVELSGEQEQLARSIGGREDVADALQGQILVRGALERIVRDLYRLAAKTMAIPNEVFVALGLAMREMDLALDALGSRETPEARSLARRAYERVNLAVIELLRASTSMGQGSGSARQRMQRMMQQQLSIREQLRRMMGSAGGLSQEQRAAMQRLAGEQRRLEELMRRAAEESRGADRLLGRLDDLAEEMREAAEEIGRGELDRELLDRQERIVSRMLESQRALERRGYSRERQSETAGEVPAAAAPPLAPGTSEAEAILEQIRAAMRERGPAAYEELIRAYFRALSRQVRGKGER